MAIENPYLGTDPESGWAMGFSWGFVGPAFSEDPPLVIAPEQLDAFNEGVLAGQQAAIDGLPLSVGCVSLSQEVSQVAEGFMEGVHYFEGIGIAVSALGRHFASVTVEGLVFAFLLMIPGPPPATPEAGFASMQTAVRDRLIELGLARHSLFLAAGIDEEVEGCELQFTALFTEIDSARNAVLALGRPHFVIARWDADEPVSGGGFEVVESDIE